MPRVSIKEAARRLGVAEATVRRRIHRGDLLGVQETTPQGFSWLVVLPDSESPEEREADSQRREARMSPVVEAPALRDLVELLRHELDSRNRELDARRREIQELHAMLKEARAQSSPQPVELQVEQQQEEEETPDTLKGRIRRRLLRGS